MAWLVDAESRRRGLAQLSCSKLCTWGRTTVRAGPCCRGMIPSAVDLVLLACLRRLRAYERGRGVTGCSTSTRVCVPLGTLTLMACARVCFLSLLGEGVGTRCCCGGEPGSRLIVRSFVRVHSARWPTPPRSPHRSTLTSCASTRPLRASSCAMAMLPPHVRIGGGRLNATGGATQPHHSPHGSPCTRRLGTSSCRNRIRRHCDRS